MPCIPIQTSGGVRALVCTRGRRPRTKCGHCKARPGELLCDFPAPAGGTCDAPLCRVCAVSVGPDRDLCPEHPVPESCSSCSAPLVWALMDSGKRCPFDPEPTLRGTWRLWWRNAGGRRQLYAVKLTVEEANDPSIRRFVSHFGTCPHAAQHRTRREP